MGLAGCKTSLVRAVSQKVRMGTAVINKPFSRRQGNQSWATITMMAMASAVNDDRIRGSCQKTAPQFTLEAQALIARPAAKKTTPTQPTVCIQGSSFSRPVANSPKPINPARSNPARASPNERYMHVNRLDTLPQRRLCRSQPQENGRHNDNETQSQPDSVLQ